MNMTHRTIVMALSFAAVGAANAGPTCPNEFEEATNALGPIYAYFGGVTNWGSTPSNTTIHSGKSLEVWANLVNDQFALAGFAVGTFGISAPALNIDDAADTFSITVRGPNTPGQLLSLNITIREDDNNDGILNVNGDDDAWESGVFILAGDNQAHVYNVPISIFQDLDPDSGNNVRNITTTGRLAYFLTFESRDAYPGGQIVGPVSLLIDHVGFYVGPQVIPGNQQPGDANGDSVVNIDDLLLVINSWSLAGAPGWIDADVVSDGVINIDDLLLIINNWQ